MNRERMVNDKETTFAPSGKPAASPYSN